MEENFLYIPRCPGCETGIIDSGPVTACNECECLFCSQGCREMFHNVNAFTHEYDKLRPDIWDGI